MDDYSPEIRKHTKNVIRRIVRLNPHGVPPGQMPRGWHPKRTTWYCEMLYAHMSKGNFVRKYGREEWDHVPKYLIIKDGRRAYVALRYVVSLIK